MKCFKNIFVCNNDLIKNSNGNELSFIFYYAEKINYYFYLTYSHLN